jgi:hypothetical protein
MPGVITHCPIRFHVVVLNYDAFFPPFTGIKRQGRDHSQIVWRLMSGAKLPLTHTSLWRVLHLILFQVEEYWLRVLEQRVLICTSILRDVSGTTDTGPENNVSMGSFTKWEWIQVWSLPKTSDSKIWWRVPWDWGPRMTVLARTNRNLAVSNKVSQELHDSHSHKTVKYGNESREIRNQEWLCWWRPAATYPTARPSEVRGPEDGNCGRFPKR